MTRHSAAQQLTEARQIARDYGMTLAECRTGDKTDYVVYRALPDGRSTRLGKRSSIEGVRKFIARLADFH